MQLTGRGTFLNEGGGGGGGGGGEGGGRVRLAGRSVTDARGSVGLCRWCRPAPRLACTRGRRRSNRRGRVRGERCGKQRWLSASACAGRRARAWASRLRYRGTGSFGAGLTRFLTSRGGGWSRSAGCGGSAARAARPTRSTRSVPPAVLADKRPATPRAGGERQALQALVAAREGAVNAKRAGLCQLRDLLITTPEPLRGSRGRSHARAPAAARGNAARRQT